jgi:hypothetical protein
MTLDDAIATLSVREINSGCETFWDGGIRVWIGDRVNGHKVETIFSRHRTAPVLDHFLYDRLYGGPQDKAHSRRPIDTRKAITRLAEARSSVRRRNCSKVGASR